VFQNIAVCGLNRAYGGGKCKKIERALDQPARILQWSTIYEIGAAPCEKRGKAKLMQWFFSCEVAMILWI